MLDSVESGRVGEIFVRDGEVAKKGGFKVYVQHNQ